MDKNSLLQAIESFSKEGSITRNEVIRAFERGQRTESQELSREVGISEVLYLTGALIVFVGISVLIGQNWHILNALTKLMITLGFASVSYAIGVYMNHEKKYGALGYAFHLMAALVFPLGLYTLLETSGMNVLFNSQIQSIISGILFCMYFASYKFYKSALFILFSIIYATWFFISITDLVVGTNPLLHHFAEYRILVIGLSYMLFGYYFSQTKHKSLTGALYGFGILFFLGAALSLGGWKPSVNIFWELIYPGLNIGAILLSIRIQSKPVLVFGTLFLMIYILKITGEYFTGTFGWPLSLMICGLAMIGVGFYAFRLSTRYLNTHAET